MTIPLACDMTAIPAADRGRHREATRRLVTAAAEIRELPDGIVFKLSADDYETAVRFIDLERLCCPFLRFSLEVAPGREAVDLRLEGPPGTGAFLKLELGLP